MSKFTVCCILRLEAVGLWSAQSHISLRKSQLDGGSSLTALTSSNRVITYSQALRTPVRFRMIGSLGPICMTLMRTVLVSHTLPWMSQAVGFSEDSLLRKLMDNYSKLVGLHMDWRLGYSTVASS